MSEYVNKNLNCIKIIRIIYKIIFSIRKREVSKKSIYIYILYLIIKKYFQVKLYSK